MPQIPHVSHRHCWYVYPCFEECFEVIHNTAGKKWIWLPSQLAYYCAVYDECKYSDTFWLADRTRLFVHYTISLPSLWKPIWRHWTYKMPVRYSLSSVIHYTTCGAVCFQFTHFPCDDSKNIYTLSYYHHQIGIRLWCKQSSRGSEFLCIPTHHSHPR